QCLILRRHRRLGPHPRSPSIHLRQPSDIPSSAESGDLVTKRTCVSTLQIQPAFIPAYPARWRQTRAGSGVRSTLARRLSGCLRRRHSKERSPPALAAVTLSSAWTRLHIFILMTPPCRISAFHVQTIKECHLRATIPACPTRGSIANGTPSTAIQRTAVRFTWPMTKLGRGEGIAAMVSGAPPATTS